MRPLGLICPDKPVHVLCLGAHSDDVEIGAGGALLQWIASGAELHVHWCVLSAAGPRAAEAEASALAFLEGAASSRIELESFRDGYFPYDGAKVKDWFEALRKRVQPDLILTHRREDAHQDHREVAKLTWNSFRNHQILEYEIPKWDGDLAQPNLYVALEAAVMERKVALLMEHFATQRSKDWFDAETFRGLARLRGMECRAGAGYAEGFVMRKAQFALGTSG
jgi:LmbE family N-acetylglucosaminyl deacetylase